MNRIQLLRLGEILLLQRVDLGKSGLDLCSKLGGVFAISLDEVLQYLSIQTVFRIDDFKFFLSTHFIASGERPTSDKQARIPTVSEINRSDVVT